MPIIAFVNGPEVIEVEKIKELINADQFEEAKTLVEKGLARTTTLVFYNAMVETSPSNDKILKFTKEILIEKGSLDVFITRIINASENIDSVICREDLMIQTKYKNKSFRDDYDRVYFNIHWENLNKNILHLFTDSDCITVIEELVQRMGKWHDGKGNTIWNDLDSKWQKQIQAFIGYKNEEKKIKIK